MICEILSIGTELLLGEVANLDAQILSQGLSALGINVYYHTVCGDNPTRLKAALAVAKSRADILITTGGLGPTEDDLSKQTLADFFGLPLVLHDGQLVRLRERMGPNYTKNNERQAWLPEGCTVLENDWGTAPGCAFSADGMHVIMLPGPPRECRAMFTHRAVPVLEKLGDGVIASHYIKVFGMGESTMEHHLQPLIDTLQDVTAAPYAKEGECEVRVTARGQTLAQAQEKCAPVVAQICAMLGDVVYGVDVESLEQVVVERLRKTGQTLAVAESCTGGLLAKRLTDVPGASACFLGGCVTYSNEMKQKLLSVSAQTLAQYGAVSEQVAREMATGVRAVCGSDFGIGITGVAGPGGGTEQKPVGLVYIALDSAAGTQVVATAPRPGRDRARIRLTAASEALNLLRKHITAEE